MTYLIYILQLHVTDVTEMPYDYIEVTLNSHNDCHSNTFFCFMDLQIFLSVLCIPRHHTDWQCGKFAKTSRLRPANMWSGEFVSTWTGSPAQTKKITSANLPVYDLLSLLVSGKLFIRILHDQITVWMFGILPKHTYL